MKLQVDEIDCKLMKLQVDEIDCKLMKLQVEKMVSYYYVAIKWRG